MRREPLRFKPEPRPVTKSTKPKSERHSNWGGKRPGAGRPKGSSNRIASHEHKVNLAILARKYTHRAVLALAKICEEGESESARIQAAVALLDRGYGKPPQAHSITGPNDGPMMIKLDHQILHSLPDEVLTALQFLVASIAKGDTAKLIEAEKVDETSYDPDIS